MLTADHNIMHDRQTECVKSSDERLERSSETECKQVMCLEQKENCFCLNPRVFNNNNVKLSLTVAQTKALESLQQRAMKIIFPDKDYLLSLIVASVYTTCCRTNGTQPSQTDYVMRKHLHHSSLELKNFASHLYRTV